MQAIAAIRAADVVDQLPQPRRPKKYYKRAKPLDDLPDVEFKRRYRFCKETIIYIVELVRADVEKDRRGGGLTPELQVLTAISCWGRKEVQDDAAELHGLSQPTVCRVCASVARALTRHAERFIKMPCTAAEQEATCRRFFSYASFPTIIGCIDCTDIKMKKHGGNIAQYYINRKGFYSLNVQVTCDADLRIRDIVARWRGSTHDGRIFSECALKERFESGEFRGMRLLGDSGYRLEPYLFTPLLRPQNRSEERHNTAHIATRNTVERCFGVWKQRFRCLLQGMPVKLSNIKTTIVALAVLHNISIEQEDPLPVLDEDDDIYDIDDEDDNEEIHEVQRMNRVANAAYLRAFINRHF